jgi:ABC-type glycerol-3-phosphate transport system substrate-binding protein
MAAMAQSGFSRRTFLGTLASTTGAVILAACGSAPPAQKPAAESKPAESKPAETKPAAPAAQAPATTAAQPAAPAAGKTTVRIHERANNVVEGGAQYELFKPGGHLDKWRADHPNVEVVVEPLPPATPEYGPKLLALHMGGTIGDVAYGAVGSGSFQYVAATGIAGPLDDFVKKDNLDLGQYLPNMVGALRVGDSGIGSGSLYGLPLLVHARDTVLFYNKALFQKAGIKPPDGDTMNWDQVVELGKTMTTKASDGRTEVYGLIPISDSQGRREYLQFQCLARAFGGELVSEDGKKALFNSPEAKKAWQWLYDLQFKEGITPAPSAGQATEVFISSKAAMMVSAGNVGYTYATKKDLDWDATPVPKGPSGQRGSMYMGDAYTMPAQAKQKDLGWEIMKWMTNKESGVLMCGIGLCGARPDVYEDPRVKGQKLQSLYNRLVADAMPFRGPANLRQVEINDVAGQVMSALWSGSAKPEDAFYNDANAKVQQVLDKPRD